MAARRDKDRSTRVTLAYDQTGFRLVQVSARPKGPGPTVVALDAPTPHDVWVEGQDSSGRVRYRLRLPRAFAGGTEVFAPDGSITHARGVRPRGVVTFVVPHDPTVTTLALHAGSRAAAHALHGAEPSEESRELFRFPLPDSPSRRPETGERP